MSELGLELVRRQRAGGREILLRYPLHTSMPLPSVHVEAGRFTNSGWSGGGHSSRNDSIFWWAATTTGLAGRLSECVQREANVSEALVSYLDLDGRSGDDI